MSWFQIFVKQPSVTRQKGEVIFDRGDAADCMFGPEGIFGEMALISRDRRSATARARSDCRIIELPEKRFVYYLVQETPHFALEVMRVMASRLRRRDPTA
jgi:hypothetical protein